ncbi:MAG: carbohydrate binding family 9 domain-containing protein [Gemmatimonadetes bacterium]|nr:carbohydrate binding family 9 domain-containing protein [Gemmatimonadota bacterium]
MEPHLILALQILGSPGTAPPPPGGYSGWHDQIQVAVPKLEAELRVDGVLDEPAWRNASRLIGFSEYRPVDGRPAEDSTEVLVWYDNHAIHFGIRAFEPHGPVNPRLADRDKIDGEDYVQLLLDTYNDRRRALVFAVNPFGVQSDGVRSEGGAAQRGGFGEQQDLSGLDLTPDFVYESKGRVTDYGYAVEIRIPFKSLRFQDQRVQDWGFNVIRKVQHSGHEQTWTRARLGNNSFLAQSGTLVRLTELRRGLVVDVTPVVTWKANGAPAATGWDYQTPLPEVGGNLRWGLTPNLGMTLTAKPDFSQVEADVAQVQALPRNALLFAEKRPFFLEGIEQLQTPRQMIYTRRIVKPVAAAKLTGKLSGTDVGFVSAIDDATSSPTGDNPIYNLLRVRRDLGSKSWVGAVYTDKIDGSTFNRVGGLDSRVVFGRLYYLQVQGAGSVTRMNGYSEKLRPLYDLVFDRTGRSYNLQIRAFGVHPEFLPASGFITRGSIFQSNITNRFTRYGKPGSILESVSYAISLDGLWDYENFFGGRNADEVKWHHNLNFTWRGGWRLGPFVFLEHFYYPPSAYRDYRLERRTAAATDTVPFTAGNQLLRNLDLGFGFSTPRFARFDASANILVGYDDNFIEWAQAAIWLSTFIVNARPTEKIRIEARYVRQQYVRWSDRSTVATRNIPRVKIEYQLSRSIFLRLVAQYDARWQDALRDDGRTGYPILILNHATGAYERALSRRSNDLRGDFLFSYQPNPGTVLFAGYGSSLTELRSFGFRDLTRTSDGFFLKFSYLFRL